MYGDRIGAWITRQAGSFSWPVNVLFIGLPLWWLLGLWQILFFIMAIPMIAYLLRQRVVLMPRGFGLWLLFLIWVLLGVLVLQVDAPGTVAGVNMNRYLVFGYRFAWYLVATIVALYVLNTRDVLKSEKIARAIGWLFVMFLAGGLLGLFAYNLEVPSLLQAALPRGISNIKFVQELTIVRAAQVQGFLGEPQPRPSAPFPYTNDWGFATAITLPFFVVSWWTRGKVWRIALLGVLPIALYVIVSSLNRGMWILVLAAIALAATLGVMHGKAKVILTGLSVAVCVVVLLAFSPMGSLISQRLDNGHSDGVRENLAAMAVTSVAQGSPLLGYGTTRNLAGTFTSIAGGATDACPGCEPPPIGTHGQLWEITFGTGLVGIALYVAFFTFQFVTSLRVRSPYAMAALASVLMVLVALPFYSSVGVPLYIALLAVGLLAREARAPLPSLLRAIRPMIRYAPAVVAVAVIGAAIGLAYNKAVGASFVATQRVLVPAVELVPVPGVRKSTLDSEAMLARSDEVVRAAATAMGTSTRDALSRVRIGAEPNTRVLLVSVEATSSEVARSGVEAAVAAFLEEREALLDSTAADVRERYQARYEELGRIYQSTWSVAVVTRVGHLWETVASVRQDSGHASDVIGAAEETGHARVISGVTTEQSVSVTMVRVANGLAIGLLVGTLGVFVFYRRFQRLGSRPGPRANLPVSVMGWSSNAERDAAGSVMKGYAPLAGVVADPGSVYAAKSGEHLDELVDDGEYSGKRAFIVADTDSRAGDVRQMIERMEQSGLEPVGLMLGPGRRRIRLWRLSSWGLRKQ